MTTNDTSAQATPTPPGLQRKLCRSRDQRVIAGVCGGLARYCGVDPIVFRIGLGVLVFFGGVGAVIYLVAWLFLPDDGDSASPVEALLGRGTSSTSTLTTVILAVIGILALGAAFHGESAVLLALAVLGIVLLARRGPLLGGPATTGTPGDPSAPAPPPMPVAYAPYGPYGGGVAGSTAGPPQVEPVVPLAASGPAAKPPKPPRERSALGRILVSATLLLLGMMLAADRLLDVSIPAPWYAAAALGMIGAGLVVGAWLGRARGLIGLGVLMCVVLPITTVATHWDPNANIGDWQWSPTSVAAIAPTYQIGFGQGTLDLRNVDFADASAGTRLSVGFGHLLVHVPRNVDVMVRASAGAGNLNVFGKDTNGSDVNRTLTDLGADGAGGGRLNLDVKVGFGDLEVVRD